MDEVPPPDRPITNRQQTSQAGWLVSTADRQPQPAPVNRVADFLRQEGQAFGRGLLSFHRPSYERAENSYTSPTRFFAGMLLTIASIATVTYYNITLGTSTDMAAAVVPDTPSPIPQIAPSASVAAIPRPDHRPPPLMAAVTIPSPDHRPPPLMAAQTMPSLVLRSGTSGDRATAVAGRPPQPAAAHVAPPAQDAAGPPTAMLPSVTDLHLRIVYGTSNPAEPLRIAAMAKLLRDQDNEIASATASSGPAADEGVVYFFANDQAAAGRMAASLSRVTKRPEPVMLVHANPLPRPGTVEIRLPFKGGKDLNNEGF